MRRTAPALALLAFLAACGGKAGDNQQAPSGNLSSSFESGFRTSYRARFIDSCTAGAKNAATRAGNTAAAGLNYEPLCGCAADKLLATKSMAELARGPSEADQLAVTQACLKEHPLG